MVALAIHAWRRSREQHRTLALQRMAEATRRNERDFAAAILDTVEALIIVLDRQGRIIRFKRACEALTSCLAEEVVGQPFWERFLLPDEEARVKAIFAGLRAGHFACDYSSYLCIKDGRRRLIAWHSTAILDEAGAVSYVIETGVDVTAEREAQAALRESEAQRTHEQSLRRRRQFHLTEQESRVLDLLATGGGNAVIAAALHIQPNTVARHIHNIGGRLGFEGDRITRQAVVITARRLGLLPEGHDSTRG